jgi:hypothetical protein
VRWPHREDWSAHLVRYIDGHPDLQPRVGPHGGFVNDRGFEHVTCPMCGGVAVWPPNLNPDVPCVVPGHRIERDDEGRIVGDTCPLRREDS